MSPELRLELQRLLSALCDGELTAAQHVRLQGLLQADSECRRLYLEYMDLHARLLVHPRLRLPETVSRADEPVRNRRQQVKQAFRYALVAAATLAASLLVQAIWWRPPGPEGGLPGPPAPTSVEPQLPGYVATLTQAVDCVWESPRELWRAGSRLLPGELRLRQGIARIRFDSGPDLVVEGPTALRLDSGTAATVLQGKVVFRADETAALFDLSTPSSTLVHFGTEYAVVVGPEGEEVHVFDGDVRRTPRAATGGVVPEHLTAGEARRYGRSPASPGQPTPLDPAQFVRQSADARQAPPDPAAGLLAYEGFDYADAEEFREGRAVGGLGWASPWTEGFARPLPLGDGNRLALNVHEGLLRTGAAVPAVGGCFDYAGFTKYWRRLATPVRLDADGVYYLSYLFRRHGPPADPVNAVAVLLRMTDELPPGKEDSHKRLNIGVRGPNELFTHLQRAGCRTPLPLTHGETYLLVAKIVAGSANPDQVFMRVYGPADAVEHEEPGSWSAVGPPFQSDLVFDWLQLHINSEKRQTIDEVRLGTTWAAVTAPWVGVLGAENEARP
jgi:hypothetical protein